MKSGTTEHLHPLCLVIDESPIVRKITSRFMKPLGFRTMEAHTSYEGLEMCEKNKPNLLIVDWSMSDMNGELFLSKLQDIFVKIVPPIIVTSVEYKADMFQNAKELGIFGFLYKPFTKDMLISVLEQAHLLPKKKPHHKPSHVKKASDASAHDTHSSHETHNKPHHGSHHSKSESKL